MNGGGGLKSSIPYHSVAPSRVQILNAARQAFACAAVSCATHPDQPSTASAHAVHMCIYIEGPRGVSGRGGGGGGGGGGRGGGGGGGARPGRVGRGGRTAAMMYFPRLAFALRTAARPMLSRRQCGRLRHDAQSQRISSNRGSLRLDDAIVLCNRQRRGDRGARAPPWRRSRRLAQPTHTGGMAAAARRAAACAPRPLGFGLGNFELGSRQPENALGRQGEKHDSTGAAEQRSDIERTRARGGRRSNHRGGGGRSNQVVSHRWAHRRSWGRCLHRGQRLPRHYHPRPRWRRRSAAGVGCGRAGCAQYETKSRERSAVAVRTNHRRLNDALICAARPTTPVSIVRERGTGGVSAWGCGWGTVGSGGPRPPSRASQSAARRCGARRRAGRAASRAGPSHPLPAARRRRRRQHRARRRRRVAGRDRSAV
eukprot:SAG11_NODE_1049_length_6032_cov_13.966627_3_plen_426_part_00